MLWRVAPRRGGRRFPSNSRGYVVESGFTLREVELIGQEPLRCWCKRRKECSMASALQKAVTKSWHYSASERPSGVRA